MSGRYQVVKNVGDRRPYPELDQVVASSNDGDKAREIARDLHGKREQGSSSWYTVREAKGEDVYTQMKQAAEVAHGKALDAARKLPGGNLVREAAQQAADRQLRLDYRAAQEAWTRIDSGQE